MKLKQAVSLLLAFAFIPCLADAQSAKPHKVGPVSYYGALHTSGSKIVGAKNNEQAMLRGLSLFWSDATGSPYYDDNVVSWLKDNLKIDVIRFALGIKYYNSKGNATEPLSEQYSYEGQPDGYLAMIDKMVESAIKNDIYIIIDWHSHRAEYEQTLAEDFFAKVSKKYAAIPNVIFEIYNEPVNTNWSTIQSYANAVSANIRQNTQNLILVGTPQWSQLTQYGGVNATNIAYVLHFYAATHTVGTYGPRATAAMNSGYPVFISEWGTTEASGSGSVDAEKTQAWLDFMETNKISNCNWSVRQTVSPLNPDKNELSAIFSGSTDLTTKAALSAASFSTSGTIVKNYLTSHASSYEDSLTKGKRNGQCAFPHQTITIMESAKLAGILNGACSYTSSDTSVISVSGATATATGVGFAILTGNDGTESIITVGDVPQQTLTNFVNLTCRYQNDSTGTCSKNQGQNYSGNAAHFEWVLGFNTTTVQGATFSIKSLNPEIVDVKKTKCKNHCSTSQGNADFVYMYDFKSFGTAKIVATAEAISGYQAMNDTVTVIFGKKANKISSKFKSATLPLNTLTENVFPETAVYCSAPVTYTFNNQTTTPYLSVVGSSAQTGAENAILQVAANATETDSCTATSTITATLVIGDSALAVNKEDYYGTPIAVKSPAIPFQAQIQNSGILLHVSQAGLVEWNLFSATGKIIQSEKQNLSAGSHLITFDQIPPGAYFLKIRQGIYKTSVRWNPR